MVWREEEPAASREEKFPLFDRHYHNPNRVKSPHSEDGKIPFFRIGALLIWVNKIMFLSCTPNFGVVEFCSI
ncbi:MAG: hypothetical protein ACREUM_02480, partial [Nitrosospira sp.]